MKNKFFKGLVASFALAVSCVANAGLINVLYTTDASGNADYNANLAAQGGTVLEADATLFNSLSFSDLSSYDLLVIGWYGSGSFNLDWSTVLLPYIENGGGLIFEAPGEIGDLAGTGFTIVEQNGSNNIASYDNFFGPAVFANTHMAITSLSSDWNCRMLNTNGNCNLATGEFGAGRAIIGGYDSFYHETGSYDYIVNQANWVTSGVAEVPEPSTLAVFALGLMGLAFRKFKKQA